MRPCRRGSAPICSRSRAPLLPPLLYPPACPQQPAKEYVIVNFYHLVDIARPYEARPLRWLLSAVPAVVRCVTVTDLLRWLSLTRCVVRYAGQTTQRSLPGWLLASVPPLRGMGGAPPQPAARRCSAVAACAAACPAW